MIIMGIDPGDTLIGFGVIKKTGSSIALVAHGCIAVPSAGKTTPQKLHELEKKLGEILSLHAPDVIGIEDIFFFKNLKTAIKVAQARGVILATCERHHVAVLEFTPLQIKQAVTGYGRAEKKQVQKMVQAILGIKSPLTQDDAADALAAAICTHSSMILKTLEQSTRRTV
ncbi:crossover junction endodeoxyribonuclease RuvC [Candidatus Azambacteria bacterium]|nr:crossover junction endodeoxyribonuclease RuvC [Candidatus Azambacteria bacterium]